MHTKSMNTVDEIFRLYATYGTGDYIGEPISQLEHMSQAAQLAIREGAEDELVLAAFFHDIGHLCVARTAENSMDGLGTLHHEKVGADFLRKHGFSENMARLVENHVQAKRYLTFRYPQYYKSLSEASRQTLELQGGRMSEPEAVAFEQDPLFHASIQLRRWDEQAKRINIPIIDQTIIMQKMIKLLESSSTKATSVY